MTPPTWRARGIIVNAPSAVAQVTDLESSPAMSAPLVRAQVKLKPTNSAISSAHTIVQNIGGHLKANNQKQNPMTEITAYNRKGNIDYHTIVNGQLTQEEINQDLAAWCITSETHKIDIVCRA